MARPVLDAMLPAFAQSSAKPPFRSAPFTRRTACIRSSGTPKTTGRNFEFQPIMKPMEPYRDYVTTISGLQAPPGEQDNGGVHMGASAAFLNGTGPVNKHDRFGAIESKKSVDQYIADAIAGDTPLRSLEVGTEGMLLAFAQIAGSNIESIGRRTGALSLS